MQRTGYLMIFTCVGANIVRVFTRTSNMQIEKSDYFGKSETVVIMK